MNSYFSKQRCCHRLFPAFPPVVPPIIVKAKFLYVSSSDGGIDDDTIEIYNIINPTAPIRVGEFTSVTNLAPAGLAITDTILYIANLGDGVEIYNINNPIAPIRIGEFGTADLNVPDQLTITGTTLYVSNGGNNTVEIYNITNPTTPVRVGEFGAEDLNAPAVLAITDTTLYVANTGDLDFPNGLAIFTVFGYNYQ